jgi:predicted phage terminase large subunit-like protein
VNLEQARYELVLKRLIACADARDQLLPFARLMMPVPGHQDDPDHSRYTPQQFHRVMCVALEELEKGTFKRLIISLPPRHGKTLLASKMFPAWFVGRDPQRSLIFGTYNEKFSLDVGRAVRDVMLSPAYAQVFPELRLKTNSLSAERLETELGGVLAFVGRGGTITGRGGDLLVIDDPLKDRHEADSPTIRDTLWTWFTQVIASRLMDESGRIMLIQTRWHQDDLIGRLTDPTNSFYDEDEAREWRVIDMPALAVAGENDVLKRKPDEALWPGRFGTDYLRGLQRRDARGFSALYQGRPSPASGAFFSSQWVRTYKPNELPKSLRIYGASDHAVSLKQSADKTCLLLAGVDEHDDIWILADCVWRAMTTEACVEAMIRMMRHHKPVFWWAERSHISRSIGPFLRKRMLETKTHCAVIEMQPISDKQTRAQSIQGRMSMGRVRFPERAPWWPLARDQILKFPFDAHDDFRGRARLCRPRTDHAGPGLERGRAAAQGGGRGHVRVPQDATRPGRARGQDQLRRGRVLTVSEQQQMQAYVRQQLAAQQQPQASEPPDMSDLYNTPLSPEQEAAFQQTPFARDVYDYDARGEFLAGANRDNATGHGADTFKKPNHPTFSDQSRYHGQDGHTGGVWGNAPDGSWTFTPSATNLKMHGAGALQQYFDEREPGNSLLLPGAPP